MHKFFNDLLTGSDNKTYEIVNVAYLLTFGFYMLCTIFDLFVQPSLPFNYQGFGTGLSLINASFGLHSLMKNAGNRNKDNAHVVDDQ